MVITFFSEAAQTAFSLNKPVLMIAAKELKKIYNRHWSYFSQKAVVWACPFSNLSKKIEFLLHDKKQIRNQVNLGRKYLFGRSLKRHGIAEKNICNFIIEKIKVK